MKTTIFLGAGASKSDGAPLQGELFRDYFVLVQRDDWTKAHYAHQTMENELSTFFQFMFNIDTRSPDICDFAFPTFEEVLGMVDLGEKRYESFLEFGFENPVSETSRLRMIRVYLIHMMAYVLDRSLQTTSNKHGQLIDGLRSAGGLSSVSFVSANYDILIDNAISGTSSRENGRKVNYGLELTNFTRELDWDRPEPGAVNLHKIHGSLNWFYCPCCNTLRLTPFLKGVPLLMTDTDKMPCKTCESMLLPIVVPPTFFKDMSSNFLTRIWANVEQDLSDCEHVIFCGYSFPDADIHIKYLLKRAQTKRRRRPKPHFTVINNHESKCDSVRMAEKQRYVRFLGPVKYLNHWSFSDFSTNPMPVVNRQVEEDARPSS